MDSIGLDQFLLLNTTTSELDIEMFIQRATSDYSQRWYFVLDVHLVSISIRAAIMKHISKSTGSAINSNILIQVPNREDLLKEFNVDSNNVDDQDIGKMMESDGIVNFKEITDKLGIVVITSLFAGLGKSYNVAKKTDIDMPSVVELNLSGDVSDESIESRLSWVRDCITYEDGNRKRRFDMLIKVDMMDNMSMNLEIINQIIFSICFLRCIKYKNGYLSFSNINRIYLEIGNTYKDEIMKRVHIIGFCLKNDIGRINIDIPFLDISSERAVDFNRLEGGRDGSEGKLSFVCNYWYLLVNDQENLENMKKGIEDSGLNPKRDQRELRLLTIEMFTNRESERYDMRNVSWTQLNSFIHTMYHQLMEFDMCYYLLSYEDEVSSKSKKKSRVIILETIFNIWRDFAWGNIQEIRLESNNMKQMKSTISEGLFGDKKENDIERYGKENKKVASWEDDSRSKLSFFFRDGSMKVIYKNFHKVPWEIKDFMMSELRNQMKDITKESGDSLVGELIEGLDLEKVFATSYDNSRKEMMQVDGKSDNRGFREFIQNKVDRFKDKKYVVTHDNYLKIMMIVYRAELLQPIVIMGATGCGKTYMVEFMVSCLLNDHFVLISLHPGVSEPELIRSVKIAAEQASQECKAMRNKGENQLKKAKKVWVLFDEFNTSSLQPLITELMVERKLSFIRELSILPENLIFIATCNPLSFNNNLKIKMSVGHEPQSGSKYLSHIVNPISDSLFNFVWDFGQLSESVEFEYIRSMIRARTNLLVYENMLEPYIHVVRICQSYIKSIENENSASLRDVNRFLTILEYCNGIFDENKLDGLVMTAYLCYFLRLEDHNKRHELNDRIKEKLIEVMGLDYQNRDEVCDFDIRFEELSQKYIEEVKGLKVIPNDISINKPFRENLTAMLICTVNSIPFIICGKPGTSKTISLSVCQSLFKLPSDERKSTRFFKSWPKMYTVNLWGSQTTTCQTIIDIFSQAKKLKRINPNDLVTVVFDEIGLAEIAPENPLKVLHGLLEPADNIAEQIGFIGLSNWRLDLSKMNRLLFVSRPDPHDIDILSAASVEMENNPIMREYVEKLVNSYSIFRKCQSQREVHPNFHGCRDIYNAVRCFTQTLKALKSTNPALKKSLENDSDRLFYDFALEFAVDRNFSGLNMKQNVADERSQDVFKCLLFGNMDRIERSPLDVIFTNLVDESARHLMIFTENNFIEDVLLHQIRSYLVDLRKKNRSKIVELRQARNKDEEFEVFNSLAVMIKEGYTLILKDMDSIYSCLYDVLNQRYEYNQGVKGCYLIYDSSRQWVSIHPEFRCIVLMGKESKSEPGAFLERKQQPPFLNRFEKILVLQKDLLTDDESALYLKLVKEYMEDHPKVCIAHNMSKELILSLVLDQEENFMRYRGESSAGPYDGIVRNLYHMRRKERKDEWILEDNEKKEREIQEKLITFHSKYYRLKQINEGIKDYPEDYERRFLSSHKMKDLIDLLSKLESETVQSHELLWAIFTSSDPSVLKKITDLCRSSIKVINIEKIKIATIIQREKMMDSIFAKESITTVVLQLKQQDEWPLFKYIKDSLMRRSRRTKKSVVVLFHTSISDMRLNSFECSSIDFLTEGWSTQVVENLERNESEDFFNYLEKPISDIISISSGFTSISSILVDKVICSIASLNSMNYECKTNCMSLIRRIPEVSVVLMERLRTLVINEGRTGKGKHLDCKLEELVRRDGMKKSGDYIDSMQYIFCLINAHIHPIIVDMITRMDRSLGFKIFALLESMPLEGDSKNQIIQERWLKKLRSEMVLIQLDESVIEGNDGADEDMDYGEEVRSGLIEKRTAHFHESSDVMGEIGASSSKRGEYDDDMVSFDSHSVKVYDQYLSCDVKDMEDRLKGHINEIKSVVINRNEYEESEYRKLLKRMVLEAIRTDNYPESGVNRDDIKIAESEMMDLLMADSPQMTLHEKLFVGIMMIEEYIERYEDGTNFSLEKLKLIFMMGKELLGGNLSKESLQSLSLQSMTDLVYIVYQIYKPDLALIRANQKADYFIEDFKNTLVLEISSSSYKPLNLSTLKNKTQQTLSKELNNMIYIRSKLTSKDSIDDLNTMISYLQQYQEHPQMQRVHHSKSSEVVELVSSHNNTDFLLCLLKLSHAENSMNRFLQKALSHLMGTYLRPNTMEVLGICMACCVAASISSVREA